jgi:hypothetical protein
MATQIKKMDDYVIPLLKSHRDGMSHGDLKKSIKKNFPEIKDNSIAGYLSHCYNKEKIEKPSRAWFIFKEYNQNVSNLPAPKSNATNKIKEEDFYGPFAEYLKGELEGCTEAIPLGGSRFGGKWGTPDVVGVIKPSPDDIIKEIEFITAEIKLDADSLITAFGQASAYKLFSHKVYLVIPEQSGEPDIDRIDSLCRLFDIGLILFNKDDPENPNFKIKNRASKINPDLYYLNENIKKVAKDLKL